MGVDYRIYLGPHAVCNVVRKPVQKSRRACPNDACPRHGKTTSANFCPDCGTPIAAVPVAAAEDAIDQFAIQERIDEALMGPPGDGYAEWSRANKRHVWIANRILPGREWTMDAKGDFLLNDIEPDGIDAEVGDFERGYADALAVIRDAYGRANVNVRWGLIRFCW